MDDEGLKQVQGLTKLRKLLLRDAVISDDGLKNLRGLVNVEQLDLGGTKISDAGVAHLRGMTKLKKLSLQGALLTDEGLGSLAAMPESGRAQPVWHQNHQCRRRDVRRICSSCRRSTCVTRASTRPGVDRLLAAMPKCARDVSRSLGATDHSRGREQKCGQQR